MNRRRQGAVFTLTRCGILSAMAVLLYYIEIPVVAFYKLDLSTLPALLAGFAMGPAQGAAIVIVKNLVHMLGTGTACVGELADMMMSSALVIPASLVYRRRRTRGGALAGMAAGTLLMAVCGALVNYFILIPAYVVLMNLPPEAIIAMGQVVWSHIDSPVRLVVFITAPFNLLKGGVLSAAALLMVRRVSPLLHPAA